MRGIVALRLREEGFTEHDLGTMHPSVVAVVLAGTLRTTLPVPDRHTEWERLQKNYLRCYPRAGPLDIEQGFLNACTRVRPAQGVQGRAVDAAAPVHHARPH